MAYSIGAAYANQLSANQSYYTYIRTKEGNASSDTFKLQAQLGYRFSPACTPTWAFCIDSSATVDLIPGWQGVAPGTRSWSYTGGAPAPPSNVSVTNPTNTSLQVNFKDNATNETSIRVERKTGTAGSWSEIAYFNALSGTGNWYWVNSGLPSNTTFCYRLRARNSSGDSPYSNEACGATTGSSSRSEVIIDDRSSDFRRGGAYWWEANIGYNSHMFWTYVNGNVVDSWGEWWANLAGGQYEVYAFIPSNYATTSNARYEVYNSGGTAYRSVNQNAYYDVWVSLGTYSFSSGGARRVRLTDATGEAPSTYLRVGFDAVKFVPR